MQNYGTKNSNMSLEDENQWLYDLYQDFDSLFTKACNPLDAYLETFEKFKEILDINPDEIRDKLDVEDVNDQIDMSELTNMINKWQKADKNLYVEIPEEIHVSCFLVSCKDLLKILSGVY